MWSRKHDRCVECGTNELRHYGKGLCRRCYGRINSKKHRKKNSEYMKTYHEKYRGDNQNYFKKKLSQWRNKKRFGGNRDKIINLDNGMCCNCYAKNDLVVHHIDGNGRRSDKQNNNEDNLVTMCNSCHTSLHNLTKDERRRKKIQSRIVEQISNRKK